MTWITVISLHPYIFACDALVPELRSVVASYGTHAGSIFIRGRVITLWMHNRIIIVVAIKVLIGVSPHRHIYTCDTLVPELLSIVASYSAHASGFFTCGWIVTQRIHDCIILAIRIKIVIRFNPHDARSVLVIILVVAGDIPVPELLSVVASYGVRVGSVFICNWVITPWFYDHITTTIGIEIVALVNPHICTIPTIACNAPVPECISVVAPDGVHACGLLIRGWIVTL